MLLLIFLVCFHFVQSQLAGKKINADVVIQRMMNESYDERVRPPAVDGQVRNFGISNIDFVSMHYDLQVTFRETWKDPRLAYDYYEGLVPEFILLTDKDSIWRPDTFFPLEKRAHRHDIDKPNILIRVSPDGTILFSERITLTLSCPMYLQKYPMDIQRCHLDMASYAYTMQDLEYAWKRTDAFQVHPNLRESLPSFTLSRVLTSYCTSSTTTGQYSCLRITFELTRQISYYVVQVYIPSTLLVIVSWVSFWLERNAVPARVTLGVTTLLTMTTQAASINSKLPPVSYIKAIDVWIGVCLLFIFGAVLEFAYVSYVASQMDVKKRMATTKGRSADQSMSPLKEEPRAVEEETLIAKREERDDKCLFFVCRMFKYADAAQLVDVKSRILFPFAFLTFNLLYWIGYLICVDDSNS